MAGRQAIGRGTRLVAGLVLGLGAWSSADAGTLDLPAGKPVVRLDVPQDWTREPTELGMELTAPDGKSVLVVGVVERDKAKLEAWEKKALAKVKAFGVVFDDKAKSPAPPTEAPKPIAKGMDFASKEGAFTFSGPPSLATPGASAEPVPNTVAGLTFESLTDPNTQVSNKPRFKVVQYVGTTLDHKPVDVQFGVYNLADKRFFAVMQESAPDDTRAVAIAKSLRALK